MQLNIAAPTSQIALLGNNIPVTRQQMLGRSLLNTSGTQASSLLYGNYLNLLRQTMPYYAYQAWANPSIGFQNSNNALQQSSSQFSGYGYRPAYTQPSFTPAYYGTPSYYGYQPQSYAQPSFVSPYYRF
jgi:hypothetical protein